MKRSGGVTYAVGLSPRKTIRGGDINFNDHEGFLVLLHFHIFYVAPFTRQKLMNQLFKRQS